MGKVIFPPKCNQHYLYWLGLSFMVLNKARYKIVGYRLPRAFSTAEIERSVAYCIEVVNQHEFQLQEYIGVNNPFSGKNVLEIGPGPDLGTGLCMMAKGASSYTALDKDKHIAEANDIFYEKLLNKLTDFPAYNNAVSAYEKFRKQDMSLINYIHDPAFTLDEIPDDNFDIFTTQAVLEHFDDVKCTFTKVKRKMVSNGTLTNLVDVASHTRFIRDIDPCNLLRYSDSVYNLFKFDGSPNRLRASAYEQVFKTLGYKNVNIESSKIVDSDYVNELKAHISLHFKHDSTLDILSFYLLATV